MTISILPSHDNLDTVFTAPTAAAHPTPAPRESSLLGSYKRAPGQFVGGQGVHLIDADGKRYLDFVSGIAVNGWAPPVGTGTGMVVPNPVRFW